MAHLLTGFLQRLLLAGLATLTAATSIALSAQETERSESIPAKADGLEVVIQVSKREFQVNEPLSLRLVFRNTTAATIWIPPGHGVAVAPHLKEISARTEFTGGENLGGGGIIPSQTPRPIPVPAGEQRAIAVDFEYFGFVEGDKDYDAATTELFNIPRAVGEIRPRPVPIPAGEYELSVEITVRDWYRKVIANEKDPVPVWNADHLRSNSVRVNIRNP
jgi:hypothetical protein